MDEEFRNKYFKPFSITQQNCVIQSGITPYIISLYSKEEVMKNTKLPQMDAARWCLDFSDKKDVYSNRVWVLFSQHSATKSTKGIFVLYVYCVYILYYILCISCVYPLRREEGEERKEEQEEEDE